MLVFWFWWEIVFGITYVLSVQYTCAVVSVFLVVAGNSVMVGNSSQNENTFWFPTSSFYEKILLGWLTLLWSDSRCMYFKRPNTLLLCIFLFCIFLLYHTDPQVEIQIRILLKEAAIVSKMQTPAITLWFFKHRFKENFYLGFFIKEKQLAKQGVFIVKSKHWVLAKIQFFMCLCIFCRIFVREFFF